MDPPLPNVQPMVWRGVNLVGTEMGYRPPEARPERHRQRPILHRLVDRRLRRHLLAPQRHRHPQRGGLGPDRDTDLHRAQRDLHRLLREADGFHRPLAGRLVAPARHRRLRTRPVEEPDQDGRPPQGRPPLQFLPDVQELDREGRTRASPTRSSSRPRRGDYPTTLKMLEVLQIGRRRDPSGQGRFHRRRPVLRRWFVRRQDGPAVQDLRLGAPRKTEIPRHPSIPRRPAGPALRQRGLDAAAADGRRLRPGRRGRSRPSSKRSTRSPSPRLRQTGPGRLRRPRSPGSTRPTRSPSPCSRTRRRSGVPRRRCK